jgi:hypothetical protein
MMHVNRGTKSSAKNSLMLTRTMKRILLLTFALCVCVLACPIPEDEGKAAALTGVAPPGIGMIMASRGNIAPISKVIAPRSKAGVTEAVATKGWSTPLREGFEAVKSVFQPVESSMQQASHHDTLPRERSILRADRTQGLNKLAEKANLSRN